MTLCKRRLGQAEKLKSCEDTHEQDQGNLHFFLWQNFRNWWKKLDLWVFWEIFSLARWENWKVEKTFKKEIQEIFNFLWGQNFALVNRIELVDWLGMRETQITLNIKLVLGWNPFLLGDDELVQQAADHAHHLRQHLHRLHALRLHRRQRWRSWKKRLTWNIFIISFSSPVWQWPLDHESTLYAYIFPKVASTFFMRMDRYWYTSIWPSI